MDTDIHLKCETKKSLKSNTAWWKILQTGIPPLEVESKKTIMKAIDEGVGVAFSVVQKNKVVGVAFIHLLKNPAAVFLDYLAVDKSKRDHHLGSLLFEYAWEVGLKKLKDEGFNPIGYFGELDIPALADSKEEKETRKRRISFYRHHHCSILNQLYFLPPFNRNKIFPMYLFYRPEICDGHLHYLPKAYRVISAIYFQKYSHLHNVSRNLLKNLILRSKNRKILSRASQRYASSCCDLLNIRPQ